VAGNKPKAETEHSCSSSPPSLMVSLIGGEGDEQECQGSSRHGWSGGNGDAAEKCFCTLMKVRSTCVWLWTT